MTQEQLEHVLSKWYNEMNFPRQTKTLTSICSPYQHEGKRVLVGRVHEGSEGVEGA